MGSNYIEKERRSMREEARREADFRRAARDATPESVTHVLSDRETFEHPGWMAYACVRCRSSASPTTEGEK